MSTSALNAFLRHVATDPALQRQLRSSDAREAAALAVGAGFEVSVGDLIRYQARATSWHLSDAELAVVERWQDHRQPYWWQHVWHGAVAAE